MRTTPKNLLLPYLENQLDTAQQENIDALLATDLELANEAKRLRRITDSLRQTAARTSSDSTTDHWPALRARLVLAPTRRRISPWIWAAPCATLAVALAAFAVVWLPAHSAHRSGRAAAHPAPISPPVTSSATPKVTPQKAPAIRKLGMPTSYTYLAPAHSLPYVQFDPLAPPPAKPVLRRWHWRKPRVWYKPLAPHAPPVLAAAKPHPSRPAAAVKPVLIPTQNSAAPPPPAAPVSSPSLTLPPSPPVPTKPTVPGSPGV